MLKRKRQEREWQWVKKRWKKNTCKKSKLWEPRTRPRFKLRMPRLAPLKTNSQRQRKIWLSLKQSMKLKTNSLIKRTSFLRPKRSSLITRMIQTPAWKPKRATPTIKVPTPCHKLRSPLCRARAAVALWAPPNREVSLRTQSTQEPVALSAQPSRAAQSDNSKLLRGKTLRWCSAQLASRRLSANQSWCQTMSFLFLLLLTKMWPSESKRN